MAENIESQDVKSTDVDEDLDNLLNSALDDFKEVPKDTPVESSHEPKHSIPRINLDVENMFSEMMKAMQVDPNMKEMFEQGKVEDSNFPQDFTRISEAAAKVIESDCPGNFADIMSETLRNLNENSENIQSQFGNPQELANLFQELSAGGSNRADNSLEDFPPIMMNIMQSFLSKDILYPSMKELVEKYPVWLEEHKESLPAEQNEIYSQQFELIKKVAEEFETEADSDADDVKRQRFNRIIGFLQQMQALGHPPADLMGLDGVDENTLPNVLSGADPSQCSIM